MKKSELKAKLEDLKDSKSSCDEELEDLSNLKHKINRIFGIAFLISAIAVVPSFLYFTCILPKISFLYSLSIGLAFMGGAGLAISSSILLGNNMILGLFKTILKIGSNSLTSKCNNIKKKMKDKTISKVSKKTYNKSIKKALGNSNSEKQSFGDFYIDDKGQICFYDDEQKVTKDSSVQRNNSTSFSNSNSGKQLFGDFYIDGNGEICFYNNNDVNGKRRVRSR